MDNRTNLVKIGKHISELRKQNGYTQKKLGELLDVSDKTISKWEQGTIAPDITILHSVAKTLGVSVDEILLGEPIKNNDFRNDSNDLSIYTNQTRKKVFRDILICFFFFSIIVLLLFTVKNIDKWSDREISVNGDFIIKGDFFESDNKSLIHIESVVPQEEFINDNVKMIEFDLVINEQIAHTDSITNESLKSFEENISLYKLSFYYYQKIDDKIIFRVNVFYKDGHSTAFDYLI
jgi:transcriptional regulator with XRE-family HTH domain